MFLGLKNKTISNTTQKIEETFKIKDSPLQNQSDDQPT
jgi:hypothetical protein